ncbi:MAG: hypothetical protein IKL68_00440 [Clostridia bacterium]|nr:hypothetical protein [Clostridia bacterium]
MDNAQKAIMIGVGLFITIIIISSVLLISNMGTNMITSAQSQLSGITKGLQNQITAAYDGKTLTGAEVIAAFQQYESSEMSIVVKVGSTTPKYGKTGKYSLTEGNIKVGKDSSATAPGATQSYPGGVYYVDGTYTEFNATTTKRTTLTELQATGTGTTALGVNASKTFYSSVIKDNITDTVIGIMFVQRQS